MPDNDHMTPAIARRLLKLQATLPKALWEKTRAAYAYARANGLSPEFAIAMAETSIEGEFISKAPDP